MNQFLPEKAFSAAGGTVLLLLTRLEIPLRTTEWKVASPMGNGCSHWFVLCRLLSRRFMGAFSILWFIVVKPCKSTRFKEHISRTLFPVRISLAWGNSANAQNKNRIGW